MSDPEPSRVELRIELEQMWADLDQARMDAVAAGERWSPACEAIEGRIKQLTRQVGPTPWQVIPIPLLELGIYQRIHAEIGVEAPVDMDTVLQCRSLMRGRHGGG